MQAAPPPTPAAAVAQAGPADPAALVTVSQRTDNVMIASSDRPISLLKAGHTEQAVLRYLLYVVDTTTVLRPSASPSPDRVRWTYTPYMQRQLCFTSITGLFACSATETIPLGDRSEGEASLPPASTDAPAARIPASAPPASGASATGSPGSGDPERRAEGPSAPDVALSRLSAALRQEAAAKFDEDNRLKVDALLKAAGVRVQTSPSPATKGKK